MRRTIAKVMAILITAVIAQCGTIRGVFAIVVAPYTTWIDWTADNTESTVLGVNAQE